MTVAETQAETEEARHATTDPAVVELLENLAEQLRDLEQRHLATEMLVGVLAAKAPDPDSMIGVVESMRDFVKGEPDIAERQAFIQTAEAFLQLIRGRRSAAAPSGE
jgi:nucleoside phosphorylase